MQDKKVAPGKPVVVQQFEQKNFVRGEEVKLGELLASLEECDVQIFGDFAIAQVRIDPDVLKRLRTRADKRDLGEYLWENVFKQALYGHVY